MLENWNDVQAQLRSGVIDRRRFLASAAALGISAATAERAFAQAPKRGGHLIMGVGHASTSDSLDPATWNSFFQPILCTQFYDTLTSVDEHAQAKPSLAESWEAKPGAKIWIFKIRKGVTFHNGKTLTAADVVYSLNHHRGKSIANALVSSFAEISATDANEVTITLSDGNLDLPYILADWHLQIVPEGSTFDGVGTGAFVLEAFEPGVRGRTKRNANDWRQDRGYVDTIEMIAINDSTARMSALLSGSIHIADTVPNNSIGVLEKNAKIRIVSAVGGQHGALAMRADRAPYDNLDLRLALKYAIDRDANLKTVLHGYGKIGNDQPIPPSDPMFAADIPQRKYDPDKAKFHFKKSGYTGPIDYVSGESTFNGSLETAQLFQASAKKAGIEIQINRMPDDGYFSKYWGKVPFYASIWAGRPTADLMLTAGFSSTSALNDAHWKNEKFDQILAAARTETDLKKRKQMYHDLQMIIRDDAASVIPAFINFIDCCSANIGGFTPSPVQRMSGYRVAEKVWLANG